MNEDTISHSPDHLAPNHKDQRTSTSTCMHMLAFFFRISLLNQVSIQGGHPAWNHEDVRRGRCGTVRLAVRKSPHSCAKMSPHQLYMSSMSSTLWLLHLASSLQQSLPRLLHDACSRSAISSQWLYVSAQTPDSLKLRNLVSPIFSYRHACYLKQSSSSY